MKSFERRELAGDGTVFCGETAQSIKKWMRQVSGSSDSGQVGSGCSDRIFNSTGSVYEVSTESGLLQDGDVKTLFLAGDSTVQSYPPGRMPLTGWGQQLWQYFAKGSVRILHSEGSRFEEATTYEMDGLRIDNRAVMARSARTFLKEGRMDDLLPALRDGDLLLLQFGHNDANEELPERYSTPSQFRECLREEFIKPARQKGAQPVLVTPIAQRSFDADGICRISFPAYREVMLKLAHSEGIPVIDLGRISAEFNTSVGEEACKGIYLYVYPGLFEGWPEGSRDDTHLQVAGAYLMAGFVASALRDQGLLGTTRNSKNEKRNPYAMDLHTTGRGIAWE